MNLPKSYTTDITKQAIDMTLSVNPLGCSPLVQQMINKMSIRDVSAYPNQSALINLIVSKLNLPSNTLLLGNGSEQIIKLICLAFVKPNDMVFIETGSFFMFLKEAKLVNARTKFVNINKPKNVKTGASLLFLANPTTPGGIDRSNDMLKKAIAVYKPKIIVIDEANGEFRENSFLVDAMKNENTIVLRTFSKVLGLAGLRIGFAIANPKLIVKLNQFQQPFPVSQFAINTAMLALQDEKFIIKTRKFIEKERNFLSRELKKRKFIVSNSITNNLYVSRLDAKNIIQELQKQNVSVIDGSFFPGNKIPGFRISIKDKKTNRIFLKKLDNALSCVPNQKLLRSKEDL